MTSAIHICFSLGVLISISLIFLLIKEEVSKNAFFSHYTLVIILTGYHFHCIAILEAILRNKHRNDLSPICQHSDKGIS